MQSYQAFNDFIEAGRWESGEGEISVCMKSILLAALYLVISLENYHFTSPLYLDVQKNENSMACTIDYVSFKWFTKNICFTYVAYSSIHS